MRNIPSLAKLIVSHQSGALDMGGE